MATINGDSSSNTLNGTNQSDTIRGFSGHDLIRPLDGNDWVRAGSGDDVLVFGGTGSNTAYGGSGQDLLILDLSNAGPGVSLSTTAYRTGPSLFSLSDGSFSVQTHGIERFNVTGGAGDDRIRGGAYNDRLFGGDGDDELTGGAGRDILRGGAGNDTLTSTEGEDQLLGGGGNDEFLVHHTHRAAGSTSYVDAGAGNDFMTLNILGDHDNTLAFTTGQRMTLNDGMHIDNLETLQLNTGGGDDTLTFTPSTFGRYFWDAGSGTDHLILDLSQTRGKAVFEEDYGSWSVGGKTITIDIQDSERLTLTGNDKANKLEGSAFRDEIRGGDGNDQITGGYGHDKLFGDAGNDSLQGGYGNDLIVGGTGDDGMGGGYGDDTLIGGAGRDEMSGWYGDDTLKGGGGKDKLSGGHGEDVLYGGGGDDRLAGERGADNLFGGAGADRFVFSTEGGVDRIHDFRLGTDFIEIEPYFLNYSHLEFTQQTGYVEITIAGDTDTDRTVIQVMNVTLAELENEANFIF
jgi:Ca2+-binding RTX toxin-like protein